MHALDKIINSREFADAARRYHLTTLPTHGIAMAREEHFTAYLAGAFRDDPEMHDAWRQRYVAWRSRSLSSGNAGRGLVHATHE